MMKKYWLDKSGNICGARGNTKNWHKREIKKRNSNLSEKRRNRRAKREVRLQEAAHQEGEAQEGEAQEGEAQEGAAQEGEAQEGTAQEGEAQEDQESGESTEESILMMLADLAASSGPAAGSASSWEP